MRINKNTLIEFIIFRENECEALAKYFEEKSLEGWFLEEIRFGAFIFKKSNPKKLKYGVDIFDDLEVAKHRAKLKKGGWEYICEFNRYQIFSTENTKITPIKSDKEMILKNLSRSISILSLNLICWITFIYYIVNKTFFAGGFYSNKDLQDISYLFLLIIYSIFLAIPLLEVIRNLQWCFKFKKCVRMDEELIFPSLKELKIKKVIYTLYLETLAVVFIILLTISNYSILYIGIGLVILAVIICVIKIIKIMSSKDIMKLL